MNVIVIGLGSMGKRRLRILTEKKDLTIFGIDSNKERCNEASKLFGISCYSSINEVMRATSVDCAFVCTSPLSHASIIHECLSCNLHVFTEINLVGDGYMDNMRMAKDKNKVLFLSSTALYRKETQAIIKKVHESRKPMNYIYHVGQYLPDWHPWESYNSYFIGDKRTNGCREILAIDLPWVVTAFGLIKSFKAVKSKNTSLNINYNDSYLIILEHETGIKGVFAVDVVSRKPVHHIDIYGENLHISWNGTADSLIEYNIDTKEEKQVDLNEESEHIDGYASFVTENPYRDEVDAFFTQIKNPGEIPIWDFPRDIEILKVIDEVEK